MKRTQGFTLIETFVAITVLMFAIVGPLTIASRGLNATLLSRDQLTATYLAQEAIEQVRFMRDTNFLRGVSWTTGLDGCKLSEGKSCKVDVWSATPLTLCDGACPVLQFNATSHRYQYGGSGSDTSFRRIVHINDTFQSKEKVVTVEVTWRTGVRTHKVEISEHIFDWASSLI